MTAFMFMVWLGGFTFYSLVVIPIGHKTLQSNVRQGFITQQVTNKLNVLGAVVLVLLGLQLNASCRAVRSRKLFRAAVLSWLVMVATLIVLVWLHPHLDTMLLADYQSGTNAEHFYTVHRWYLIVASIQWLSAIVILLFCLCVSEMPPLHTSDS